MIDAREQIAELMETICDNVKFNMPEGQITLPLITYAEITNVNSSKWIDRISYQINVYASTLKACVELMNEADTAMRDLGFQRTYLSPDSTARQDKDLYMKAGSYVANIDLMEHAIINNFDSYKPIN